MNERLFQLLQYKTGGVQTEFCALLGWTPQYLAKLLKGTNFGLVPVVSIIRAFPEVNARWFLTGEGEMLNDATYVSFHSAVRSHVEKLFELERYIPVMTPSELRDFEDVLHGKKAPSFSPNLEEVWELRLSQRNETLSARVRSAQRKSEELCKTKEVKRS